jgi:hypothetical protein
MVVQCWPPNWRYTSQQNDIQHNDNQHKNKNTSNSIPTLDAESCLLSVFYADCSYAESHFYCYDECHFAECRHSECRHAE